jgi:hypothetical protein
MGTAGTGAESQLAIVLPSNLANPKESQPAEITQ